MVAESANMSVAQLAAASSRGLIGGAAVGAAALINATQPFLFVGVLTHPNATERRRAVRETWVAAASPEVDYKFVHYQVRDLSVYPLLAQRSRVLASGDRLVRPVIPCSARTEIVVRFHFYAIIRSPSRALSAVLRSAAMLAATGFLSPQAEATPATLEEAALHGDMIFVEGGGGTDYRSIVYKTFALVQWVVANRQPKFVLKTDDDAYVHTANLIQTLRVVRACCVRVQYVAPLMLWARAQGEREDPMTGSQ